MKWRLFNSLVVFSTLLLAYLPIRALPNQRALATATVVLQVRPVELPAAAAPLELAGAWVLDADDARFGGVSALTIDRGQLLAVTDRGAVLRFDFPTANRPQVQLSDLRQGPAKFGKKWARDAESLALDPSGRGWWVGFEQYHSLWLYDPHFRRPLTSIDLGGLDWRPNRGAEGLLVRDGALLALRENGRQAVRVGPDQIRPLKLHAGAEIADAASAPDGSAWVLLRQKDLAGITQTIGSLAPTPDGYRVRNRLEVPKAPFDNYEGMAIEARPDGRWRFWLISDDGHRILARTLLVALDYRPPRHDKSPAQRTGLSKKPAVKAP